MILLIIIIKFNFKKLGQKKTLIHFQKINFFCSKFPKTKIIIKVFIYY